MIVKIQSLFGNQGFRRYFANTTWLFAEKVIRMTVGLIVGVWVARYLGPNQYGLLSYAQSFVGLFSEFATLGLDGIVVRELVKDESKKDELLGTAFWLKLAGAFVVLGVLAIAVNFTSNDNYTNLLVFIIASATVFQAFNVIDFYFQAKVMGKYIAYANAFSLFISSIIKVALIIYKAPLMAFAWMVVFDTFILSAGYFYFYVFKQKDGKTIFPIKNFNIATAKGLLKDSWPLILSGLVIMIYMRVDQVMIMEMLGSEAVGQYAAAVRLSEAWYFVPIVITSSLFPAIINAKNQSEELYYARLQRLFDLMVWLALLVAFPMTFLSDWLVKFLYGNEYNQAGSVLMIHVWAGVFVALGVASGKWYTIENLQVLAFWRTFYGMVSNIILNAVLIPNFAVQGAAISTLFSYIIAGMLSDFFNKETKKIFFLKLNTIRLWRVI